MNPKIKPTNKVAAGALTGSVVVVLTYIADLAGTELPATVVVSIATILSGVVSWFVPDK